MWSIGMRLQRDMPQRSNLLRSSTTLF
jgi:hypothetical protein